MSVLEMLPLMPLRSLSERRLRYAQSYGRIVPVFVSRRASARRGRVMLDPTRYEMGGVV